MKAIEDMNNALFGGSRIHTEATASEKLPDDAQTVWVKQGLITVDP